MTEIDEKNIQLLSMTSDIVCTYISQNQIEAEELPNLIKKVFASLENPANSASGNTSEPAVPINKSVKNDYIICLEDGKKLKMLRRYLKSNFDMTPEEYREKWGLPRDYPMVAPSYSKKRSALAKDIGLGNKVENKMPKKKSSGKSNRSKKKAA